MQPQQPTAPAPGDYQFIMDPSVAPKGPAFSLPGGSLRNKLLYGLGGLLILVILLSIIKGLLGGGGNYSSFVAVTQDQQSLIHLSTAATQQEGLNVSNQNFAETALLSVTSDQRQLLTYLNSNHHGVKTKTLNLKISTNLDNQLKTAAGGSTYDATFQQIMSSQLKTYQVDLNTAYPTAGTKGKALLKSEYHSAGLLITQLNS